MTREDLRKAVVNAALEGYQTVGHNPVVFEQSQSGFFSLCLPGLRRLETVHDELPSAGPDLEDFRQLGARGLEVWALVPLSSMWEAHGRFRGVADRIQAWWWDGEDKRVKFGVPEMP